MGVGEPGMRVSERALQAYGISQVRRGSRSTERASLIGEVGRRQLGELGSGRVTQGSRHSRAVDERMSRSPWNFGTAVAH